MNSLKTVLILVVFLFIENQLFSQGMPVDKTTNKVTYTGEVQVANINQADLTDKIASFLSGYTKIRGSISSLYVNTNQSQLSGVFTVCATSSAKSMQWFVNAAFTIKVNDGNYQYKVTDLYVYATTVSNMYGSTAKDSEIEVSDGFNVSDFTKKNDNAQTAHNNITNILNDLKDFVLK